jgi:ribonuclease R
MPDEFESRIIAALTAKGGQSLTSKALAKRLGINKSHSAAFRRALRNLQKQGRLEYGRNHTLRAAGSHGTVTGIFRRTSSGAGFVRPHAVDGKVGPDIHIREDDTQDASSGDEVLVRVTRRPHVGSPGGIISSIIERATNQFVGTYFERDRQGFVRVDGTVFSHSIFVGDPGAKGARPDDKVVIEMIRFPSAEDRGEGVITEVLGARGQPGVDTLSIIRAFGIPDEFPPEVLREAREMAREFDETKLHGREDFTDDTIITIDPVDARDFDDAVSLKRDKSTGHWILGVHIADVSHFASHGGSLDREARKRGTSVYLPQRVIPMFPEIISNGLASLQQDRVRYVKSAIIEFTPAGQRVSTQLANGAIRNKHRFNYGEVSRILERFPAEKATPIAPMVEGVSPEVASLLLRMRELALILRGRRKKRGALELVMPQAELEYDDKGRIVGAHFAENDISHQMIEEFMLAANEAVADHFASLDVAFLRRVHPAPDPVKLQSFAQFARLLGYRVDLERDRFALQRVLEESTGEPEQHAVHFALLRSLKQAVYSPIAEGHYALASNDYCHFTSPIRRYPDLTVHRLLGQWLKAGRVGSAVPELIALGDHCSRTERRAETAERELTKVKLLTYMESRIGEKMHAVITGVADYGFYAQAEKLPAEGLVHVSSLTDDYYVFDEDSHTLLGRRSKRRYRLGDRVRVEVAGVDVGRRQMDFRVVR